MDKSQRSKSKTTISKIAAEAAISFQNIPFSPGLDSRHRWSSRAHHHHHHYNKGFSGPLIPDKAAPSGRSNGAAIADQEPTSPRVSCLGQIKQKKKTKTTKPKQANSEGRSQVGPGPSSRPERDGPKGPVSELKKIFGVGRKSYAARDNRDVKKDDGGEPSLGKMRKFASSRAALADFDWTTTTTSTLEEEKGGENNYDDEVRIPFSGPIFSDRSQRENNADSMVKKEISLWKRRTMAQPKPLQLDMIKRP